MSKNVILAVDPSTTISGYCFGTKHRMMASGIVRGPATMDSMDRVDAQIWELMKLLGRAGVTVIQTLVVEKPATWGSGGRGMKAATSGALTVLARAEGVITTSLKHGLQPKEVVTIEAIRWKGQLPKEIMFDRMNKKYGLGLTAKTQAIFNQTDAVGLFDWYLNNKESKNGTYKRSSTVD